jgi:glutamate-1-semialdehyde 2,1-aminomutase
MNLERSRELLKKAAKFIPGGVNSPVRSFKGMSCNPPFIQSGKGAWITDEDSNRYIDYVLSWGPLILGHSHPSVVSALQGQLAKGVSYGAPTELEVELAELLCEICPGLEQVRMVNSGTEATMSAIRLARAVTGRKKLLKFNGCYHGHSDSLLVQAGSGGLTFGEPNSPGILEDLAKHTLTAEYNCLESVKTIFKQFSDDIAAVIIEPVPGNMGLILPEPGFLEELKKICQEYDSLLIFDEVMSGFRVDLGGAQEKFGVQADLVCYGKVVGGGLPVGAFAGSAQYMQNISPVGNVYQAGTLSGNPLAMAAGLATIRELISLEPWGSFSEYGKELREAVLDSAKQNNLDCVVNLCGSMIGIFPGAKSVRSKQDVDKIDSEMFAKFHFGMLEQGIYIAPSKYEAGFLSIAHGAKELEKTIAAIRHTFSKL